MSNYGLLYNTYDFQQQPGAISPSTTNYFEKQIKEGLPFFNQNKLQSTLRNNYFNDTDINGMLRNGNNRIIPSNEKVDNSDIEAKRIIEREMNPYLSYMKKEIKLIVENFEKNLQEKNDIINEILLIKKEVENIKVINETLKNDLSEKIQKNKDELNDHDNNINKIQLDLNKLEQLYSFQSNQNDQFPTLINEIAHLKEKINILENNSKNMLSNMTKVTENAISNKFNENLLNIKNLKDENEQLKNKIDELNNNINEIKFENKNIDNEF